MGGAATEDDGACGSMGGAAATDDGTCCTMGGAASNNDAVAPYLYLGSTKA